MPNQRVIAATLGINQATVSRALRGDPTISERVREQVRAEAERLEYRPNAYVSSLMAHIRSGKPPRDMGCVALLVDAKSRQDWLGRRHITYTKQYEGIVQQADRLGFHTECFFLKAPGFNAAKIGRILTARGITGLILEVPYQDADLKGLNWDHFAMGTIGYTWPTPQVDRVASHHLQSVDLAFSELWKRGYRRIGMSLSHAAVAGGQRTYLAGFWPWYYRIPKEDRIPLFVGIPEDTPLPKFRQWMEKWRPEVLVTLIANEREWLDQLGLGVPRDIGLVCLNRLPGSPYSGIEENHAVIGAATLEIVAAQILHNQCGLPAHPRLILIDGIWGEGGSLNRPPKKD